MAVILRHFVIFARLCISHSIHTTSIARKITLHFYIINGLHFLPSWVDIRRFFFFYSVIASSGSGPLHFRGFTITHRHSKRLGLLWTSDQPRQRPLSDDMQQPQGTDFHAPCGIRNRIPSKRAAADLGLRPR